MTEKEVGNEKKEREIVQRKQEIGKRKGGKGNRPEEKGRLSRGINESDKGTHKEKSLIAG